jgi:tRNA1Val (adenine37-N6)-methyltransferase
MTKAAEEERFFDGGVTLAQSRAGYRVNIDSLHLVRFASKFPARAACDLGAGSGILGLGLMHLGAVTTVAAVERCPQACALLERNFAANARVVNLHAIDVADMPAHARFGLVVSNPPYFEVGRKARDAARSEACFGSLEPFLAAAARALTPRGRFALCYPATQLVALCTGLRARGLEPKTLQCVHSRPGRSARIVLVCAQRGRSGISVLPPVYDGSESNGS